MDDKKRKSLKLSLSFLIRENTRFLYGFLRKRYKPYLKILCMKAIIFYQKHYSKHTCLYKPTCSQYTLECINNQGVVVGILMGVWRILRCNPFTKGGFDKVPDKKSVLKWIY